MAPPPIMLNGVPIVIHAGAPELTGDHLGGETVLRLSDGRGIKMTHFGKASGSISGQGWMPVGLDGLDYSQPLDLRLNIQESITGPAGAYLLTSTPRPDVEPWAQALVGRQWVPAPCVYADGQATIGEVPGASLYNLSWLPQYLVYAGKPQKTMSSSQNEHGWTLNWEEV